METAVVAARLVQFAAAVILFGTPLFFLYGLRGDAASRLGWPKPLLVSCAGALVLGAGASLLAQTATMAGDPAAAFDRDTLGSVLGDSAFGVAILVRAAAAAVALVAGLVLRRGPPLWLGLSALGAVALASFAWTGHGAAEEGAPGQIHAAADVLHLLAAGVWLGALAALTLLLATASKAAVESVRGLHGALAAFSGIGSAVVAVIVATGLVNSWFLVGPSHIWRVGASPYGQLLLVKLGLFVGMLGLAAANRFVHTPNLERGLTAADPRSALAALRRSVFLETAAAAAILVLVSILGTLAPVSSR